MAQVLKENVRSDILNAAREEMFLKGVRETSMRDIAKVAQVTPGNLYRYFDSKEEIVFTIIHRPLLLLNKAIEDLTDFRISLKKEVQKVGITNEGIIDILMKMAKILAEVYSHYPKEMTILMNDENINEHFKDWLTSLLAVLLKENARLNFSSDELRDRYALAVAVSVFYGIKECFIRGDKEMTEELLRNYFLSLVALLKTEV